MTNLIWKIKIIKRKVTTLLLNIYDLYIKYKLYIWISCFIVGAVALGFSFYYFAIYFKKSLVVASVASSSSVNVEDTKALVSAIKLCNKNQTDFFTTYMPITDFRRWFHSNYDSNVTGIITNSPKILYDKLDRAYYIFDFEAVEKFHRDNLHLTIPNIENKIVNGLLGLDPKNYTAYFSTLKEAVLAIKEVDKSIVKIQGELVQQKIAQENAFSFGSIVFFCLGVTIYAGYKIITS